MGAVHKHLLKRVAELEAEIATLKSPVEASNDELRTIAKRDSDLMLDWYEDMTDEDLCKKYSLSMPQVSNIYRYITLLDGFRFEAETGTRTDDHK